MMARVQSNLATELAKHICTEMGKEHMSQAINMYIIEWMIDLNVRFAPTELVNGGQKE